MIEDDPGMRELVDQASAELEIAQMIYDARESAGLSQAQLAKLIGTTQSVISRLEDANYRGHSLMMLNRIAAALGKRVELRLVPARKAS
jgi:transcriptional regulator with XRE-family HTH domain